MKKAIGMRLVISIIRGSFAFSFPAGAKETAVKCGANAYCRVGGNTIYITDKANCAGFKKRYDISVQG